MTQSFVQDRKRVERRHHRLDSELQARARPYSLVRKDTAKEIREFVERQADDNDDNQMGRRLVLGSNPSSGDQGSGTQQGGGGGGNSGSTGTGGGSGSVGGGNGGGSSTGGGNSGTGTGNGSGTGTGTGTGTGSNSGSAGNSGNKGNSGDRSGSDTGTGTGTGAGSNGDDTESSSTSSSSKKGILGGLDGIFHHSSTTSSSSSSTTSSSPTPTTSSTSSILPTPSTSVAYVTPTAAVPTLNNAAASATPSDTSDNGPGAGLIIGIVAGALAGVAVLAALIGFLIKKFGRKDDPYESDPFDNDEFRRQSAMLPDTFDDMDHNPEMSEMNHHHHNVNPFNDEMEYAAAGVAGAGAATAFTARNESGGPRPPTMFQKHMNAPAAQLTVGDGPPVPVIGSVFNPNGVDPSPSLPPMAFGGSDPYSMAGVGRPNFDNNINNPYGYLDRQYSGTHSPPQEKYVDAQQGYADLDRTGSDGSMHAKQMYSVPENDDYRSYDYHDTAGRPGTAEGRSGTPDLPNVQQTYAKMADDGESDSRVQSPNRQMVASPTHLSQDFLSNGGSQQYQQYSQAQQPQQQQYNQDQYYNYQHSEVSSPPSQPLQVRNLLPNPHLAAQQKGGQRPVSGVSSVADDEAAYDGVW